MSDDTADQSVDALRELIVHPGFKLLCSHAAQEWGSTAVVNRCRLDGKAGLAHLMPQTIAVADAIMHMLAWPVDEIARLEEEQRKAKAREQQPLVRRRA